jgi:hypothetical protein
MDSVEQIQRAELYNMMPGRAVDKNAGVKADVFL